MRFRGNGVSNSSLGLRYFSIYRFHKFPRQKPEKATPEFAFSVLFISSMTALGRAILFGVAFASTENYVGKKKRSIGIKSKQKEKKKIDIFG